LSNNLSKLSKKEYPDSLYLRDLALSAGDILLDHFHAGVEENTKPDRTLVTVADTSVNDLVLKSLEKDFPHISVLAEEGSREVAGSEYRVICDPLDGTTAFCVGIPFFSFCISVVRGNTPLVAVILDPVMGRMWHATKMEGAFKGDQRLSVSRRRSLDGAKISAVNLRGSPYNIQEARERLSELGVEIVSPQSIAYMGGLLAESRLDATVFGVQKCFETAAMQLIVEEAGGRATDLRGNRLEYGPQGEVQGHIISNGLIHNEIVEVVALVQNCSECS